MNHREAKLITQKTETEEFRISESLNSKVTLHPKMTHGAFVMNYIEEQQAEINRLSKENVYLQSDEYLNTIFPTNYIQELKDKIDVLEKENDLLKKENPPGLNPTRNHSKALDPWLTYAGEVNPKATYGGYNSSYVQGLQEELTKVTEENFYFKSKEYQNKISNRYIQEKKSMTQKIKNLCQFILKLSHDSTDREKILMDLKQILDH